MANRPLIDATQIFVNIGLGNGFLTDGTEPLPEPRILTYIIDPDDWSINVW